MISRTLLLLGVCLTAAVSALPVPPFLSRKKTYTPLYFFKIKGDPVSVMMETTVTRIEKELGVRVERLDARDSKAKALMDVVGAGSAPALYHRESLQLVGSSDAVNFDHVRAWAKGRFLPPKPGVKAAVAPGQFKFNDDDEAADQEALLDASLTPEQKSGKDAIQRRTREKAGAD